MVLNASKIHMLLNKELRHILLYGMCCYTSGFNRSRLDLVGRNYASLFMTFWILIHIIQVKEALAQFLKVEMKIVYGPLCVYTATYALHKTFVGSLIYHYYIILTLHIL